MSDASAYGVLASLYDSLSTHDLTDWRDYLCKQLQQHGVARGSRVYDAACGTGRLSVALYRKGYRVIASDLSADMLGQAVQHARQMGAQIPFLQCDMRKLHSSHPQDAVLASCDAVNYLLTPQDVRAFLQSAAAMLRQDGVLIFDCSTPNKLQKMDAQLYSDEWETGLYLWSNAFDETQQILNMQLSFFQEEADGRYRRSDELHRQRAWTQAELGELLCEAGFAWECYDTLSMDCAHAQSMRMHFVGTKRT